MTLSGLLDSLFLSLKYSSPNNSSSCKSSGSDKSIYTHMSMIDQNVLSQNTTAKESYNEYCELGLLKSTIEVSKSRRKVEQETFLKKIKKGKGV